MPDEAIKILENINKNLEELKENKQRPRLIYAKEISENYKVNRNKAIEFCKKYGTNFGGYCIEADRFKEILQNKRNLLEGSDKNVRSNL